MAAYDRTPLKRLPVRVLIIRREAYGLTSTKNYILILQLRYYRWKCVEFAFAYASTVKLFRQRCIGLTLGWVCVAAHYKLRCGSTNREIVCWLRLNQVRGFYLSVYGTRLKSAGSARHGPPPPETGHAFAKLITFLLLHRLNWNFAYG